MGQYREWLHYREVDQQLQEQRAILEQTLAQLQEQVHPQEQSAKPCPSPDNNTLIHALLRHYQSIQYPVNHDTPVNQHEADHVTSNIAESSSPASTTAGTPAHHSQASSQAYHDAQPQGQTDPQIKVPWWLRNMRNTPDTHTSNLVDHQSQRTNRLVERWFERWKETTPTQAKASQLDRTKRNRQEDQRR